MSNSTMAKKIEVTIRGKTYPVTITGKGMPCLIICLGTPSLRSISHNFTQMFEVYSSDMYWIASSALTHPEQLTMEMIIDDIKALGAALNLQKYLIFAHSAYGIIALEFAKKYPGIAAGILMIGTPLNSNKQVAEKNNELFEKMADPERKAIDAERHEILVKQDLTHLTSSERWKYEYIYRCAPRYWHIPDYDCSALWEGVVLDNLLNRLFTDILPKTDVLVGLEKINEPIFLAAGISDYDCCPWVWKEVKNLPPNFTISTFKQSGHWPHYEEADLFDKRVYHWLQKVNLITE